MRLQISVGFVVEDQHPYLVAVFIFSAEVVEQCNSGCNNDWVWAAQQTHESRHCFPRRNDVAGVELGIGAVGPKPYGSEPRLHCVPRPKRWQVGQGVKGGLRTQLICRWFILGIFVTRIILIAHFFHRVFLIQHLRPFIFNFLWACWTASDFLHAPQPLGQWSQVATSLMLRSLGLWGKEQFVRIDGQVLRTAHSNIIQCKGQ